MEYLSLWELCEKNLGFLYWGPEGYERNALEAGISPHRSPDGEPGRHLIYQGLCKVNEGGHWK